MFTGRQQKDMRNEWQRAILLSLLDRKRGLGANRIFFTYSTRVESSATVAATVIRRPARSCTPWESVGWFTALTAARDCWRIRYLP